MAAVEEQPYSASQIVVPPTLPSILKRYAKAAIRTQPYDLLVWSAAYFKAMAAGEAPPVKTRLEYPPPEEPFALTVGYIRLLITQIGKDGQITREDLIQKWHDVCLPEDLLEKMLQLGKFADVIEWPKFVAIAIGFIEETLKNTMIRICETFTEEPEGGSAMIPVDLFLELYRWLGEMDCGPVEEEEGLEEESTCESNVDHGLEEIHQAIEDEPTSAEWDNITRKAESSKGSVETLHKEAALAGKCGWPDIVQGDSGSEDEKDMDPSVQIKTTSNLGIPVLEETPSKEMVDIVDKDLQSLVNPKEETQIQQVAADEEKKDSDQKSDDDLDNMAEEEEIGNSCETSNIQVEQEAQPVVPSESENAEPVEIAVLMQKDPAKKSVESEESEIDGTLSDETSNVVNRPLQDLSKEPDPWVGTELAAKQSIDDLRVTPHLILREKKLLGEKKDDEEANASLAAQQEEARLAALRRKAEKGLRIDIPGIGPVLPNEMIETVEEYARCAAQLQSGYIMPRNLRHFLCPPLDLEAMKLAESIQEVLKICKEPLQKIVPLDETYDHEGVLEKLVSKSEEVVVEIDDVSWLDSVSNADSEIIPGDFVADTGSKVSVGARLQPKASIADLLITVDASTINATLKSLIMKTPTILPSTARQLIEEKSSTKPSLGQDNNNV